MMNHKIDMLETKTVHAEQDIQATEETVAAASGRGRKVAASRVRSRNHEKRRKEHNRREAFGIVGRLIQIGYLDFNKFDIENNDDWADHFRNVYLEIIDVLDHV